MEKAKRIIKEFEGLRLQSYKCPAGVWTIGYGHTKGIKPNMTITESDAERLLDIDIVEVARTIRKYVTVHLNDNQAQALVSFIFNVGPGNFANSTLLRKLNAKDYKGASLEFQKWVYSKGKKLPGLVRRRKAEMELFLCQ